MDYRVRDLTTSVPLDHDDPSGERIDVFCREVSRPECTHAPAFVFLQGGPGVESPRDLDGVAWLATLTASSPDAVYDAIVANVHAHSMAYYRRYPGDVTVMRRLVDRLRERPEPLDDGGRLTARRLLDLGMLLGSTGGPSRLHSLLDDPFIDSAGKHLRWSFIERVRRESHYETNPLFVLLQEAV
ncbi:hypothetical protein [Arhodomonas sp. AD133]|uniref:hypothetical protein n=1 Tax=Arhodomonas sp. AD133 TaxID=3415009 RepID=UPI003EBE34B1